MFFELGIRFTGPDESSVLIRDLIARVAQANANSELFAFEHLIAAIRRMQHDVITPVQFNAAHLVITDRYMAKSRRKKPRDQTKAKDP